MEILDCFEYEMMEFDQGWELKYTWIDDMTIFP
jgi:hypothetical protein